MKKTNLSSFEKSPDTSNFDWSNSVSDISNFDISFNATKAVNSSIVDPKLIHINNLTKKINEKNHSVLNLSNLSVFQKRKQNTYKKTVSVPRVPHSKRWRGKKKRKISVKNNIKNLSTVNLSKFKAISDLTAGNSSPNENLLSNKDNVGITSDCFISAPKKEILQPCINLSPLVGNNEVYETVGKRKSIVMFPLKENAPIKKSITPTNDNLPRKINTVSKKKTMKNILYKNVLTKEAFKISKNNKRQCLVIDQTAHATAMSANTVSSVSESYNDRNDCSKDKSIITNNSFDNSNISNRKSKLTEDHENKKSCVFDSYLKISANTSTSSVTNNGSINTSTEKSDFGINFNFSNVSINESLNNKKVPLKELKSKEFSEIIKSNFQSVLTNEDSFEVEKEKGLPNCITEEALGSTMENNCKDERQNLVTEINLDKTTDSTSNSSKISDSEQFRSKSLICQDISNVLPEKSINHKIQSKIALSISKESKNITNSSYNLRGKNKSSIINFKPAQNENSSSHTKESNININNSKQESNVHLLKTPTMKNSNGLRNEPYNKLWNVDLDKSVSNLEDEYLYFIQNSTTYQNTNHVALQKSSCDILTSETNISDNVSDKSYTSKKKTNSLLHPIGVLNENENSKTDIHYLDEYSTIDLENEKKIFPNPNIKKELENQNKISNETNKSSNVSDKSYTSKKKTNSSLHLIAVLNENENSKTDIHDLDEYSKIDLVNEKKLFPNQNIKEKELENKNQSKISNLEDIQGKNKSQSRYFLRNRNNKTKYNQSSTHKSNTNKTKSCSSIFPLVNYDISAKSNSCLTLSTLNDSKIMTSNNKVNNAVSDIVNDMVTDYSSFHDSSYRNRSLQILTNKSTISNLEGNESNKLSLSVSHIQLESPLTVSSFIKNIVHEKLSIVESKDLDIDSEKSGFKNEFHLKQDFYFESNNPKEVSKMKTYLEHGTQTKKSKIISKNNRQKIDRKTQCQLSLCKSVEFFPNIEMDKNNLNCTEINEISQCKTLGIHENVVTPLKSNICNESHFNLDCNISQRFSNNLERIGTVTSYLESTRLSNTSKKPNKLVVNLSSIKNPNSSLIGQTEENINTEQIETESETETEFGTDTESSIADSSDSSENLELSGISNELENDAIKKQYETIIEETEYEYSNHKTLLKTSDNALNDSKSSEKSTSRGEDNNPGEIYLSQLLSPIKCEDKRVKFVFEDDFIDGFSTFVEKNDFNQSLSFVSPTDPILTTDGINFRGLGKRTRAKTVSTPYESIIYDGDQIQHRKIYPSPNTIKIRKARLRERILVKTKSSLSKFLRPLENETITICNPQSDQPEKIKVVFEKTEYSYFGFSKLDSITIPRKDSTVESVNNQSQTVIQMIPNKRKESVIIATIGGYQVSFTTNQKIIIPKGVPYRLYNPNNQIVNIMIVISLPSP